MRRISRHLLAFTPSLPLSLSLSQLNNQTFRYANSFQWYLYVSLFISFILYDQTSFKSSIYIHSKIQTLNIISKIYPINIFGVILFSGYAHCRHLNIGKKHIIIKMRNLILFFVLHSFQV